jgi:hypothetical protein
VIQTVELEERFAQNSKTKPETPQPSTLMGAILCSRLVFVPPTSLTPCASKEGLSTELGFLHVFKCKNRLRDWVWGLGLRSARGRECAQQSLSRGRRPKRTTLLFIVSRFVFLGSTVHHGNPGPSIHWNRSPDCHTRQTKQCETPTSMAAGISGFKGSSACTLCFGHWRWAVLSGSKIAPTKQFAFQD